MPFSWTNFAGKALPLSSTINEKALADAFDKGLLI